MGDLSSIFRQLPSFKGKTRLAGMFLKKQLYKKQEQTFIGKHKLKYTIPNTIDAIGMDLYIDGIFEKPTISLVSSLLKPGSIFFDVGANIGAISLPIAKQGISENHLFEASREVFNYLKKNVEDNNLENIKLNQVAVHALDGGELDFYEVTEKYGGSSLASTYTDQQINKVKTVSLDAYCQRNNIQRINVLKIDVQGFELEVFRGASELLGRKAIDNIIFEYEDWAEVHAGFPPGSAQEFLLERGYEIFTLRNHKLAKALTSGNKMLWAKVGG